MEYQLIPMEEKHLLTLAALEGFIATRTWGSALMLAVYAAAALQCCKAADKLDIKKAQDRAGTPVKGTCKYCTYNVTQKAVDVNDTRAG